MILDKQYTLALTSFNSINDPILTVKLSTKKRNEKHQSQVKCIFGQKSDGLDIFDQNWTVIGLFLP